MKESKFLSSRAGFAVIEILIALAVVSVVTTVIAYEAGLDIGKFFKSSEPVVEPAPASVPNPFPTPTPPPAQPPVEPSLFPNQEGAPIVPPPAPKVIITGIWHGRFDVIKPSECAGESGGWEANLKETNGIITGSFTTDVGISGNVNGTSGGGKAKFDIGGGGSGISFDGEISGGTMSGTFLGLTCTKNAEKARSTGNFFGGREM